MQTRKTGEKEIASNFCRQSFFCLTLSHCWHDYIALNVQNSKKSYSLEIQFLCSAKGWKYQAKEGLVKSHILIPIKNSQNYKASNDYGKKIKDEKMGRRKVSLFTFVMLTTFSP
uniref:Uncharacterized protein n=1 Tax=Micrurus surinamensis TaxID=129470 RepID=A0A2D4PJ86_MICSU